MYIIVEATDMNRTLRFMTLTVQVNFDPMYEQSHRGVSRRIQELQQRMIDLVNEYYPESTTEQLTDEEYQQRLMRAFKP